MVVMLLIRRLASNFPKAGRHEFLALAQAARIPSRNRPEGTKMTLGGECAEGLAAGPRAPYAILVAFALALGLGCTAQETGDPADNIWFQFSVSDRTHQQETFLLVDLDGVASAGTGRPARPGEAPGALPGLDPAPCFLVLTKQGRGRLASEDRSWLESRLTASRLHALRADAIPREGREPEWRDPEACPELPDRVHLHVHSADGGPAFFEDFALDAELSDETLELLHRLQAITESFLGDESSGPVSELVASDSA